MTATLQTAEREYYTKEYVKKPSAGYPQLDWKSFRSNTAFIDEVARVAKRGSKILDLGCGNGRLSFALSKYGFELWGIDFAPSAIRRARQLAKQLKQKKCSFPSWRCSRSSLR